VSSILSPRQELETNPRKLEQMLYNQHLADADPRSFGANGKNTSHNVICIFAICESARATATHVTINLAKSEELRNTDLY